MEGWIMINLYPVRTPKPDELPLTIDEAIAKKNIEVIKWIEQQYRIHSVYAACGSNIEKCGYLVDECQKIVDSIHCLLYTSRCV